ncbi:hypothetical protein [Breoghania sp.]|uniref:hypothetical protein n=1 Tax=Breoghania sp. TaxID=2065378 RepID=UPI0026388E91|nr:hypothetical protein [Breoghania sp.]MDJ0931838.1 hypothetical protein [Breoghania sp.]
MAGLIAEQGAKFPRSCIGGPFPPSGDTVVSGSTAGVFAENPVAGDGWGDPLLLAVGFAVAVLMLAGGFVAWRYRDELRLLVARL